jgi:hypothetical protein
LIFMIRSSKTMVGLHGLSVLHTQSLLPLNQSPIPEL